MHYPGAVEDSDTGELISNAEVAETRYTLRLSTSDAHRAADGAPRQRCPLRVPRTRNGG